MVLNRFKRQLLESIIPDFAAYPKIVAGDFGTAELDVEGGVPMLTLTTTSNLTLATGGDAAALAGGVKLYDFPQKNIRPIHARIKATISLSSTDMTTVAGEIGLGTVIGSGVQATLGAVGATSENFMEGVTLANMTPAATPLAVLAEMATFRAPISGVSAALDLFLNHATTYNNFTAGNTVLNAGAVVQFWFIPTAV